MSAPTLIRPGGQVRALAHAVLTAVVRGRRGRGGPWGEAVLAEFGQTTGGWAAVRWAAGGIRVALRERRAAQRRRQPRWVRISRAFVVTLVVGLLAPFGIDRYLLHPQKIYSGNMEPTLLVEQWWLTDRIGFRGTGIRHGDIVLIRSTVQGGAHLTVGRVVALPGDSISCRDGRVWRNGGVLHEPYLPADPAAARTDCVSVTVPEDALYLLGDHRAAARDSRHDGVYPADDVQGRLLFRAWPLIR